MDTPFKTLPQDIYVNKKAVRAAVILYVVLLAVFAWAFWSGSGEFKAVIFMPIGILCIGFLMLQKISLLRQDGPIITLTNSGIQFSEKEFREIGLVKWEDVTGCSDRTQSRWTEQQLFISVRDPNPYASRIENPSHRSRFLKRCTKNQALLWTNVGALKADLVELKKTIFQMIDKQKA